MFQIAGPSNRRWTGKTSAVHEKFRLELASQTPDETRPRFHHLPARSWRHGDVAPVGYNRAVGIEHESQ